MSTYWYAVSDAAKEYLFVVGMNSTPVRAEVPGMLARRIAREGGYVALPQKRASRRFSGSTQPFLDHRVPEPHFR